VHGKVASKSEMAYVKEWRVLLGMMPALEPCRVI